MTVHADWLQGLRPDWQVRRPRSIFVERRETSRGDDIHLTPSQHFGVLPQGEYMKITGSKVVLNLTGSDSMKHVEPNDFVIHLRSFQGGIEHSKYRGKVSNAYTVLTPGPEVDPGYFRWVLKAPGFIQELATTAEQLRDGQSIRFDQFARVGLPLPPLEEQRRIAAFLDDQIARIDNAIALRRDQVVVIDSSVGMVARRNVTGVDASQELVPSGIPWAPFIPTGWGAPRICQVARMGTGHTPSRAEPGYWVDCDIPWLTTADVHRFRHDEIDELTDTEGRLSQQGLDNSAAVLHPKGTVALSRTASAGFSVVMGADMATSQDFATWTCGPQLDNMFLLWCLRAMRGDLIGRLAMGSTHKTIYFPDLMAIRIPLPDLPSQRRIASETTSFAMSCRAATAAVRRSIGLLRDYKTSLITQAVAGDLDVTTARRGVPV